MCNSGKKNQFFRPWTQEEEEQHESEPSAFTPIEPKRSCSVSSDDTNSSYVSNYETLKNLIEERARQGIVPNNMVELTTLNPEPTPYHHSTVWTGTDCSWYGPNYKCVQEAVQRLNQQDADAKRMKKLRPKKFKCEFCHVAFSNNGQLKGHLRIHTGERPFKCDVEDCGKSFTRNEELTRHKRIHTGLRPYLCPACNKGFGRKDHLKKHIKTHDARYVLPNYHHQFNAMAAAAVVYGYRHPTVNPFPEIM